MNISFTCANCSRAYSVSESLAGKKALCKDCGTEFRVPMPKAKAKPAPAPEPIPAPLPARRPSRPAPPAEDRFGFEDLPAPKPRFLPEEEDVVLPRRAPATYRESSKRSRKSGDGGESANTFCFGGFWIWVAGFIMVILTTVAMIQANDGATYWGIFYLIGAGICSLGILGMSVGLVIGLVNLIRFQELPRVGIGGGLIWVLALILTPISLIGMIQGGINGYKGAIAKQNGQGGGQPPIPFQPGNLPQANPFPQVGPPRSDVRITLANGQVSRKSNSIGTELPGVQVRVTYRIESGRAMGEKYVLMIKSRNSQAKLLSFNLHGSGALSGSNPTVSIDDGPFEAWMELESFDGQNSRRVSDTITLQVAENNSRPQPNANQSGQPNGIGQQPGNQPGRPPGFPPMGPRGRGGRGFPGGQP